MSVVSIQDDIERKLADHFELDHLEVHNESGGHNVPAGSESHFKVTLVTEGFAALGLVARHRRVNDVLRAELAGPVHALAIHTYTPDEWRRRFGAAPMSPPCLGGKSLGGKSLGGKSTADDGGGGH
jgi:BolA protein